MCACSWDSKFYGIFQRFRRVFSPYLSTPLRRAFCIFNVFGTIVFVYVNSCFCTSPVYCINVGENLYFVDMCIRACVVVVSVWPRTRIMWTCICIDATNVCNSVV